MRIFCFFLLVLMISACKAPGRKSSYVNFCQELLFDLNDGTLNGVKPTWSQSEIKEWLPCYTKLVEDGGNSDCGGAILYSNHDFYFYTYLDNYIEVRSAFKGKVSGNLLHQSREAVRNVLGEPLKNTYTQEDSLVDFFKRDFGCVRVHYEDNKAVVIAAHYVVEGEEFNWCKE